MNKTDVSKRNRILLAIVAILTFIVINGFVWYVNRLVPFMMDDDWYATKLFSEEKIRTFSDIIEAQKWHYMNWGGRVVAHGILQAVLLLGENVADVLNTLFLILTGIIINRIVSLVTEWKGSVFENILSVALIEGLVLGFSANWEMSMFWQAGACNYLYISVFILIFILLYIKELLGKTAESKLINVILSILIVPLSIIAGCSNENMGPVCFLFSVATIVYSLKKKQKTHVWMYLGSLFSLFGSAACILAPGNMVRSKEVKSAGFGIIWKAYLSGYYETRAIFEYLIAALLFLIFAYVLYKYVCGYKLDLVLIFILVSSLLSWGAMALSPHYPDRATYGTMILIIVAVSIMLRKCLIKDQKLSFLTYASLALIAVRGLYFLNVFIGNSNYWIIF